MQLNGIMVNGIIQLMWSGWPWLNKSQMSLNRMHCIINIFSYCYHSVNGISYGLAQSDTRKECPLQLITFCFGTRFWLVYQSGWALQPTPFCLEHSSTFDARSCFPVSGVGDRWKRSYNLEGNYLLKETVNTYT